MMLKKQMQTGEGRMKEIIAERRQTRSVIYMLLASLFFATGGLVLKWCDWPALAINGARSLFGGIVVGAFMLASHHKLVLNRVTLLGAVSYAAMTTLFVMANQQTTAGNAIVLQFSCPVWIVLFNLVLFRKKPSSKELLVLLLVAAGILCFFLDSLSTGHVLGDMLALVSGFFYAILFMINSLKGGDAMSSVFLGQIVSMLAFGWMAFSCPWTLPNTLSIIWLGACQVGLAYVFFSLGTALIDPLKAALISSIEPVLNPTLVALAGYEQLSGLSLLGAAIVIGAVVWNSIPSGSFVHRRSRSVRL